MRVSALCWIALRSVVYRCTLHRMACHRRSHLSAGSRQNKTLPIQFNVPSIVIVECENASAGGEKDHMMGFWMVDIMTRKNT